MEETSISVALREHVKGTSRFGYFQNGELHYVTNDTNFEFTVPVSLTFTARFGDSEKSLSLMKFIKAQLIRNEEGRKDSK